MHKPIQFLLFILFTMLQFGVQSQNIEPNMGFYAYLVNENYLQQASQLEEIWLQKQENILNTDSFAWYKAQYFVKQKFADSAAVYFSKIQNNSVFYSKSRFEAVFYYSINSHFEQAELLLSNYTPTNKTEIELRNFQLASVSLLKRNFNAYETVLKQADTSYYHTHSSYQKLNFLKTEMLLYQNKSPLAAATFSSIIPGSGKFYAGKKGEAVSVFISVLALGAVFYENANKFGITHFRSIATGSIFGIFYLGNIAGSYHSVNRSKKDFYEKMDKNILYHIQHSYSSAF
jgi:TM2 domain-containing membrane protein YozV